MVVNGVQTKKGKIMTHDTYLNLAERVVGCVNSDIFFADGKVYDAETLIIVDFRVDNRDIENVRVVIWLDWRRQGWHMTNQRHRDRGKRQYLKRTKRRDGFVIYPRAAINELVDCLKNMKKTTTRIEITESIEPALCNL